MSQENRLERSTSLGDEDIPSMLEVATKAIKIVNRMKKHAETCPCCKEAMNENGNL